jgi:hypothetical protein
MKAREELTEKIAMMLWHVTLQQRLRNNPSTTNDQWEVCSEEAKGEWREWAAVAVSVAAEEMLKKAEWSEVPDVSAFHVESLEAVTAVINSRRSLYLKPKTAEERVTVSDGDCADLVCVLLDGRPRICQLQRDDAEIYRLGLIQQLKEKSQ